MNYQLRALGHVMGTGVAAWLMLWFADPRSILHMGIMLNVHTHYMPSRL